MRFHISWSIIIYISNCMVAWHFAQKTFNYSWRQRHNEDNNDHYYSWLRLNLRAFARFMFSSTWWYGGKGQNCMIQLQPTGYRMVLSSQDGEDWHQSSQEEKRVLANRCSLLPSIDLKWVQWNKMSKAFLNWKLILH